MQENIKPLTEEQISAFGIITELGIDLDNERMELIRKEYPKVRDRLPVESYQYIKASGSFTLEGNTQLRHFSIESELIKFKGSSIPLDCFGSTTALPPAPFNFSVNLAGTAALPETLLNIKTCTFTVTINNGNNVTLQCVDIHNTTLLLFNGYSMSAQSLHGFNASGTMTFNYAS
ncbi:MULTISPECIES: hypothetical protein [Burkholderia]|uniref:hypothetical protein n=1 Tax=Burkholderia TaxID=32008 RepID=UPI0011AF48A5|nr:MULTISPECIES: hypothetical protein [unclassified Burkholderia]